MILSFGTPHSFTGSGDGVAAAVVDEPFGAVADAVAEVGVVAVVGVVAMMVDVVVGAAVGLTEQYQLSK